MQVFLPSIGTYGLWVSRCFDCFTMLRVGQARRRPNPTLLLRVRSVVSFNVEAPSEGWIKQCRWKWIHQTSYEVETFIMKIGIRLVKNVRYHVSTRVHCHSTTQLQLERDFNATGLFIFPKTWSFLFSAIKRNSSFLGNSICYRVVIHQGRGSTWAELSHSPYLSYWSSFFLISSAPSFLAINLVGTSLPTRYLSLMCGSYSERSPSIFQHYGAQLNSFSRSSVWPRNSCVALPSLLSSTCD